MRIRNGIKGIATDDEAQALAEFVIVVPVIFLVFMLMIQYLWIVHVAQLGSYAAYVSGRVYAVRECLDENDAKDKAEFAAALALAPVASLAPGEFMGAGIGNLSDALSGVTPAAFSNVLSLAEGYAVARYVRLQEDAGGGSITIEKSGSPAQVDVAINYPQPIFIPGLAELWRIVGGEKDIFSDLKPMSDGLKGMSALGFAGKYPYVNVRSKCSMGCESWSGTPIRRSEHDDDPPKTDPELNKKVNDMKDSSQDLKDASKKEGEAYTNHKDASDKAASAQTKYDSLANSGAPQDQIDSAKQTLDDAKTREQDAKDKLDSATGNREKTQQKWEKTTGKKL